MPFTAHTLAELSLQASELMRSEQESLWKVKKLMASLCGDFVWAPCGIFVGPNDIDLYRSDIPQRGQRPDQSIHSETGPSTPMLNGDKNATVNGTSGTTSIPDRLATDKAPGGEDVPMSDGPRNTSSAANAISQPSSGMADGDKTTAEPTADGPQEGADPRKDSNSTAPEAVDKADGGAGDGPAATSTSHGSNGGPAPRAVEDSTADQGSASAGPQQPGAKPEVNGSAVPRRNAADSAEEEDEDDDGTYVHPFFDPPACPLPDRDMGLPDNEAENVRQLMSLYVQKQEEICRGTMKLYQGLLKADRLRATVLGWAKAEAHVGELSDGEDWYDREEWGLSDDLCKGQDEEEEDTTNNTTQPTKKTRNRRQ
jgi:hypothetical protein